MIMFILTTLHFVLSCLVCVYCLMEPGSKFMLVLNLQSYFGLLSSGMSNVYHQSQLTTHESGTCPSLLEHLGVKDKRKKIGAWHKGFIVCITEPRDDMELKQLLLSGCIQKTSQCCVPIKEFRDTGGTRRIGKVPMKGFVIPNLGETDLTSYKL